MITRVYIDNFRCFSNFEFKPKSKQLLMGRNGSGKSTFFDVAGVLRDFVIKGTPLEEALPASTRTRWQNVRLQSFELDVAGNGGAYVYSLRIEQRDPPAAPKVDREALSFDGKPVFLFEKGDVHLFNDRNEEKVVFPFDWGRSGLAAVAERPENKKLTWFKRWIAGLHCLRIDPRRMTALAPRQSAAPALDLANFAEWYGHILLEQPSVIRPLFESLAQAVDGFESLDLKEAGQGVRVLKARCQTETQGAAKSASSHSIEYEFDELSDGQRVLVGLYTLLHCAVKKDSTICIDEPDNFVSLQEIQPWLLALMDRVDDVKAQVILISHHPEIINQLAPEDGVRFERIAGGPVIVRAFGDPQSTLTPAEQVARGWDRA
jgi:energy-coupling factor transporter ATP-binding protein EcfA2